MFEVTEDKDGIAILMLTIYGFAPVPLTWDETATLTKLLIKLCRSADVEIGWPKTPIPNSVKRAFKM